MLTEQRYQYILNSLKKDGIVKLQSLINGTGASESTLRRDLQELEDDHQLQRIHGGAKRIISANEERTVFERSNLNHVEKNSIAKLATTLIEDGDVIFLDSGTSTKEVIQYLTAFKNILVVTNSIDNASLLADYQIKTYLPSGILKHSTKALVGAPLVESLEKYRFDIALLGTNGFSLEAGFTTPDPEEATVKSLAIKNAKKSFVLADKEKFNQDAFCQFATFEDSTLITNNVDKDLSHLVNFNILEVH
ncbi:DeoR family transcriptional regulator [Companilactobacillus sp. RD055328]|uniref:DeoR/GlpR family DNA-binding transcription regulator n=1 Tax=Companilactobacillus sp. RD055328 TaxID=2916634 RepID=UPI001FC7E49B|nr:DeoR/GlpR family DNA-binding transcription regulator [Companilactobacillus sp. RD055328]GKQ42769.1 DeoR family transcriptional regulator [Companilactobacillus sp. RD055328]